MSEITNESLKKIGKGTIIALMGTGAGLLFAFVTRIIIARYGTGSQYGIFSLALVVLGISVIIASFGLQDGTARYVAYFRSKGETGNVQRTVSASIQFATIASMFLCLILFFISDIIATRIFHDLALILPLKIFAFGIPFLVLINVFISIFRGFDRVQEKVYFQDIMINVLFLLLLLPVILLHISFIWVFYAYLVSVGLSAVILVLYATRRLPMRLTIKPSINSVGKQLYFFSLPLLGVSTLQMIITYTDTLMLGYFKTSDVVGLYNAAYPIAQFIDIPMGALLFIYAPIITGLYAKNSMAEIRKIYAVLTKWIFLATFPLFLMLLLFPETVLNLFFGTNYVPASQALRVLSMGFIIVNLLGPNGITLMVIGRTRFLMWASAAAAGVNVILNIALIPQWGIVGASIATAISLAVHCLIRHIKVQQLLKVNTLTKTLLKSTIISTGLILVISFLVRSFLYVTLWMLPLLFILFYAVYFVVSLFNKSFEEEDIMMLAAVENRIGVNVTPVKKMLKKFL